MSVEEAYKIKRNAYKNFYDKYDEIRSIIIKRKSAFGCYEWLKLCEVLKIDEK